MATLFAVVAYMIGLFGTLVLVPGIPCYLLAALIRRRRISLFIAVAMLCGYVSGATLVWNLLTWDWSLSLSTTFAASVNAAKYGHPTEHYAQGIVVGMAFGAVVGAIAAGGVTAVFCRQKGVNAHASA
jgi:hypothetical protein